MKKSILLFLFIVQVSLYAQEELEYRPFVEEGKVWNMFYKSNEFVDVVPDYEFKYFIEGDTLIAGQNCKKFYSFNEHYNNQTEYKMALHESEGKVYFIPSGSTESYILYDFTIPVGTSTVISSVSSPESNIEMRNNRNGITKTNGISRHCLLVNKVDVSIEDLPSGWWIEGIGSELGPLYTWQFGLTGNIGIFLNCEVNGETVFNMTEEPVSFTAGQIATIILPTAPDASKGKYYRLDRYEDGQIIFEQELQPQAHIPYIIVPNEDFSIDLRTLDLTGLSRDTVSIAGISFIGSYVSETFDYPDGFYIDFIDITHDCRFEESCVIGALRAYLLVRWDDPYNQGGTRVPPLNKRGILLRDYETDITSPLGETGEATLYDLQGRMLPSKPAQGIYIKNRQKVMVK